MSWRVPFLLGRPGLEASFEINPATMKPDDRNLQANRRGLGGELSKVTLSRSRPMVTLNGNYISPAFLNQLRALSMVDDTMLVFEDQDDFTLDGAAPAVASGQVHEIWQERVVPDTTTLLTIPDNSWLKGDRLRAAVPGLPLIRIISVADTYRAGRLGSTERYDTNGSNAYTLTVDALTAGDLDSQGTPAWSRISGTAHIDVNTTSPITGTKDLLWALTSLSVYRLLLGFTAGSFRLGFNLKVPSGQEAVIALGSGVDTFIAGTTAIWTRFKPGTGIQVRMPSNSKTLAYADDNAVHAISLEFFNGVLAVYVDGVQAGRVRGSIYTVDRLMLGAFATTSGAHMDDIVLQTTNGSFNHATGVITLQTALPDVAPRFVTYQATGFGCNVQGIPAETQGGNVNRWRYDVTLEGA